MFPGYDDMYDTSSTAAFLTWVHADSFFTWFATESQTSRTSVVLTPRKRTASSQLLSDTVEKLPSLAISATPPRSTQASTTPALPASVSRRSKSDIINLISDDEDSDTEPTALSQPSPKVKKELESDVIDLLSDSDGPSSPVLVRAKRIKLEPIDAQPGVKITRQQSVKQLFVLTALPTPCWTIPSPSQGLIAYLLDLRNDKEISWVVGTNKRLRSIASVIKGEVSLHFVIVLHTVI